MRKALEIGGFVAAAVLIVFGVASIVMGVNGRSTVNSSLSHEYIVGSPDMTYCRDVLAMEAVTSPLFLDD